LSIWNVNLICNVCSSEILIRIFYQEFIFKEKILFSIQFLSVSLSKITRIDVFFYILNGLTYTLTSFHFPFLNHIIPIIAIKTSANVIAQNTPEGPKSNVIAKI